MYSLITKVLSSYSGVWLVKLHFCISNYNNNSDDSENNNYNNNNKNNNNDISKNKNDKNKNKKKVNISTQRIIIIIIYHHLSYQGVLLLLQLRHNGTQKLSFTSRIVTLYSGDKRRDLEERISTT